MVLTTAQLAPLLWLITCAAILVSFARRPGPSRIADQSDEGGEVGERDEGPNPEESSPDTAATESPTSESDTELSPQLPA